METRTHIQVRALFINKYPNLELISQFNVSKIKKKIRKTDHVRDLHKGSRKQTAETSTSI